MILAGLAASWLLWPRQALPAPLPVDALDHFTASFLARAESFRGPQSLLALAVFLIGLVVPLAAAATALRQMRRGSTLLRGGALRAGVLAAGVFAATLVVQLPLQAVMHARAGEAGLSVQSSASWLGDLLLGGAITLLSVFVVVSLGALLLRRFGRAWWAVFWVVLVLLVALWQLLSPVLVEPLFADFRPLPAGQLERDVRSVAERSGVDAGTIYEVDAARRTTGVNAYVSGLGLTRRVVLYDTLTRGTTRSERLLTIAHEFGHARHRDLLKGLIWFALVAFVGLAAADRVTRRLLSPAAVQDQLPTSALVLVAAALVAAAVSQPSANALSRAVEARADAFAVGLTGRPEVAVRLERTLTVRNLSRPDPPAVLHWFFGTHPTSLERIGSAQRAIGRQDGPTP